MLGDELARWQARPNPEPGTLGWDVWTARDGYAESNWPTYKAALKRADELNRAEVWDRINSEPARLD